MTRSNKVKLILLPFSFLTMVSFQNCSSGGFAVSETTNEASQLPSDPQPTEPTIPSNSTTTTTLQAQLPPSSSGKILVTVGVGVGGRRVTGIGGFTQIISDQEVYSPAMQAGITTDPNVPTKLICPTGFMQLGNSCCLGGQPMECMSKTSGYHSDFIFRAAAYGNGRFVAVGGASHGISQVSIDGINWGKKYNLVSSSGLVTGAKTNIEWFGGLTFGKGKFVGIVGYTGQLVWSLDGINWVTTGKAPSPRSTFRRMYFIQNRFYAAGDGNAWAFSDDGLSWTATGVGPVAPEEVYEVGSSVYGFAGTKIYRLNSPTSTQWEEVYTHPTNIGSFGFNKLTQKFLIFINGYTFSSLDPTQGWVSARSYAQGRWIHFTGEKFVGGTSTSSDGVSAWRSTPSPTGASSGILSYASGLIDSP